MMLDTLIATLQEKRADLGNIDVKLSIVINEDGWRLEPGEHFFDLGSLKLSMDTETNDNDYLVISNEVM